MDGSPIPITSEAAAWVVEQLHIAAGNPEVSGHVPILGFCADYQVRDRQGHTIEAFFDGFFEIGWHDSETIGAHHVVQITVDGRVVFAWPDTLERLEGKQLVLETSQVGYPRRGDKLRRLLRAASIPAK